MRWIYNIGIAFYSLAIRLGATFNERASLLVKGRSLVWKQLNNADLEGTVVWVHCASLGEFEQGRPLIEAIRLTHPEYKILLTFFSPSGYEVRKNYPEADLVIYLPADTKRNAQRFIKMVRPHKVFFIKYEYWYHYFRELSKARIPLYMVSSIFRPSQIFFQWYGGWFRKILKLVTKFFVQDEISATLLSSIEINNYEVAGDTRFDRVSSIAASAPSIPIVEKFAQEKNVIVAGSTWPPDEAILANFINHRSNDFKLIIAPHEVHDSRVVELIKKLKVPFIRFSQVVENVPDTICVLIIDTIGVLSTIYRYGTIAYIGGGFGIGIHNTLEAATFGMPVIFGPKYKKFREAVDLIEKGGGFSIQSQGEFQEIIDQLMNEDIHNNLLRSGQSSKKYVESMCGATALILNEMNE
ncbi:MAG TPA: glycosyltransferase N-terminal domain-containing protein [Marinilabiliaceae bacterium]|nr:glycosyltransferase N-terminal domain-containing protein [Marinilabiliaceae bacterium]